ncbi:class I SAM-dependent methyltransferase [Nocardia nova]|uniref:class I SAM-dependent methyltransferase n=1 Tax=Nocardia nova TaxID=37330 RepID=UPI000CE9FCB4|nr:class I SAM-dependent methyltransferase [Nocardia nova]PPJ25479.1 SAM-dependent methyltransferase [Nocardia nova]
MTGFAPAARHIPSRDQLPDEFFALFLDPTRTYSCAYWTHPDDTLEQAQSAKIDLALAQCDLRPGMTLLDVGCGWGSTMLRAMDTYGVNAIGLTPHRNQHRYVRDRLVDRLVHGCPYGGVRRQGWQQFDRPVDRIVCIGALEQIHHERYPDFFDFAYRVMPDDGVLLLQTVVAGDPHEAEAHQEPALTTEAEFAFLRGTVFASSQLPRSTGHDPRGIKEYAQDAGFTLTRSQELGSHYTTLDRWVTSLHEHRDRAIEIAGQQTYDAYIGYLTGCADTFRRGHLTVMQFTFTKPGAMPPSPH